jgi:hypothetical protein
MREMERLYPISMKLTRISKTTEGLLYRKVVDLVTRAQ